MNHNGEAYLTLQRFIEDWTAEYDDLVRRPDIFARHVADFVFDELLTISSDEIDTED